MPQIKYDIKLCKLKNQHPTDVIHAFIELNDTHLFYSHEFYAKEKESEDEGMPFVEDIFNSYQVVAKRANVCGVELSYSSTNDTWKVSISLSGFVNDLYLHFKSQDEATEVNKALIEWMLQ